MQIQLMDRRVEFIQNMKESMVDMDKEGNEIKYFASKFLVQKYLHLSDADIKLNEKYKQEEIEELNLAGGDDDGSGENFEALKAEIKQLRAMIMEKASNHPGQQVSEAEGKTKENKDDDPKPKKKSGKKTGKNKSEEEEE